MTVRSWALALVLAASAPSFAETAQKHVAAARAAEKRSDWRKALREWKAAYRMEINAEYLIRIGDAYAHLGNKAEARKQYEAYLGDPLALPASAVQVKAKIAALDGPPGGALALDLPASAAAKGKQAGAAAPLPLPLPELDGSAPKAAAPAKKDDLALALPALPGGPAPADAGKKPAPASGEALAAAAPAAGAKPAAVKPSPTPDPRKAPVEAVAAEAHPTPVASGGTRRTVAWVAAGVAVVALGTGALAYGKASSVQSDLTGSVHDSGTAKSMLDSEQNYKTLSAIGFAVGLVAAGVSTALFVF
jgi:hypothetical protein